MQVDHLCYLLSPIKALYDRGQFPREGLTVWSMFDGIGGAIVALHRLGVPVRHYITSEAGDGRGRRLTRVVK